jgi:hypothetical protein
MNSKAPICDLVQQNHNSRKLTSEAVEALTGKPLEWFIEAVRKEGNEDGNKLTPDSHDNKKQ